MENIIELLVDRVWPMEEYTVSKFFVNGNRFSESLEDTDRGLTQDMPLSEIKRIKVPGKTAIPKGRYEVVLTYSPRFHNKSWARKYNGLVPEIIDVPGYSGVRIHPGTDQNSTDGCLLVGENKVKGGLVKSAETYMRLMDEYLIPASKMGKEIWITIK